MPPAEPRTVLRFDHVHLDFGEGPVLDDVSFRLLEGETCVILGSAGSGKTVLLKTSLGLLRPSRGLVSVFDEDITRMKEEELFTVRSRIGMLFQEGGLFDSLTIEENVSYPLLNQRNRRPLPGDTRARAEEALRFVELEHTLEKFPSELSGGMRRRVGIARAVVTEPELVLYDSPTAGLDPITSYTIMSLIAKERDVRGVTAAIVTHRYQDGNVMAKFRYNPESGQLEPSHSAGGGREIRTRFMVLRDGRLVFDGTQQQLEAASDPYISRFVRRSV